MDDSKLDAKIKAYCNKINSVAEGMQETRESIQSVKDLAHTILNIDKSQNESFLMFDIYFLSCFYLFFIFLFYNYFLKTSEQRRY